MGWGKGWRWGGVGVKKRDGLCAAVIRAVVCKDGLAVCLSDSEKQKVVALQSVCEPVRLWTVQKTDQCVLSPFPTHVKRATVS